MDKKKMAAKLATVAAVAFVSGPIASGVVLAEEQQQVHCYGVNSCKGSSACKTATSACNGQNACKGQGFVMKTADECKELGGSLEEKS